MRMPSPEIPLPDQSDYFWSAELVDEEAQSRYGGINRFLFHKERALRDDSQGVVRLVTKAYQYGNRLEPRHEVSGQLLDPTSTTALSVRLGIVAGLVIVERFHRKVFYTRNVLDYLPQNVKTTNAHVLRARIRVMGEQGLDLLGDKTVKIAEKWQDAISEDSEKQLLFMQNIGLVALGARNAHIAHNRSVDRQAFEQKYADFNVDSPEFDAEIAAFLERST